MSSLVLEIEDYVLEPGVRSPIDRLASYFLLMTGSEVDVEFFHRGHRIGGGKGLSGGDAVGPLSQKYDRVTLTSATAQTVKVATTSDPVTITRLSGVVRVDGVIQTASDYDRSQQGEALQAYGEVLPVAGSYGVIQFQNPVGSGKNWIVQKVDATENLSTEAAIVTALEPVNQVYAFATNKLQGQARPNINIYKGAVATRPEPQRTVRPVTASDNPLVIIPGGVLTVASRATGANTSATIDYFEVTA